MIINITEEVGKYLKTTFVYCLTEGIIDLKGNYIKELEGEKRDRCFTSMEELFDDAIEEFDVSDAIDDAIEKLKGQIKDLLYEEYGDEGMDSLDIDREIDSREEKIKRLKEILDDYEF